MSSYSYPTLQTTLNIQHSAHVIHSISFVNFMSNLATVPVRLNVCTWGGVGKSHGDSNWEGVLIKRKSRRSDNSQLER